jgi:hypothetical protein
MWMLCLAASALFTGLTFFVQSFWQLAVVRRVACGFAQVELAVSTTDARFPLFNHSSGLYDVSGRRMREA